MKSLLKSLEICSVKFVDTLPGTVMLLDKPLFAEIESIFVVSNDKFVQCHKLLLFMNMFSVTRSGELCLLTMVNLTYSLTQVGLKVNGEHLVVC